MNPSYRRRTILGAGVLAATAAAVLASSAQAASWSSAQYPTTKGAAQARAYGASIAIAQAANGSGKATLLYQTRANAIYATKRSSKTGTWGTPAEWLAPSKARLDAAPAAFDALWGGGSVWGIWSTAKGHKTSATTSTWAKNKGSAVRTSNDYDAGAAGPIRPTLSVAMSSAVDQAVFGISNGGTVSAGTVPWGKAPMLTQSTPMAPNPGGSVPNSGVLATSSSGEVAALLAPAGSPVMQEASADSGSQWTPGPGGVFTPWGAPDDIAIDAQGNGIIGYVVAVNDAGQPTLPPAGTFATQVGVFVSQRVGRQGTWSAPQLVQVHTAAQRMCFTPYNGTGGTAWSIGFDGLQVAVDGGTSAVGYVCSGGGSAMPNAFLSSAATGQPLPAPTVLVDTAADPNGSSLTLSTFSLAANPAGQSMVAFGYSLTQGQTDNLWASVSPAVDQPWAPLKAIDNCSGGKRQGAGGGFGDVQVAPFASGFTVAWECVNGDGETPPNNLGIATYR